jgi:hypothetical protein
MIMAATNILKVITPEGKEHSIVVADSCHFGRNMQAILKLLKEVGCEVCAKGKGLPDRGQGFINQNGTNFNRSEAYTIAINSGQAFNNQYTLPNEKLDSSCIRHFEYKLDDLSYHNYEEK